MREKGKGNGRTLHPSFWGVLGRHLAPLLRARSGCSEKAARAGFVRCVAPRETEARQGVRAPGGGGWGGGGAPRPGAPLQDVRASGLWVGRWDAAAAYLQTVQPLDQAPR